MTTAPTAALSVAGAPSLSSESALQQLLKVVSDERRFAILQLLHDGEHCVCEVVAHLGLSQPLASHHLRVLQDVGLLRCRHDGRWAYYSIDRGALARLQQAFAASFDPAAVRDRQVECDERGVPIRPRAYGWGAPAVAATPQTAATKEDCRQCPSE